MKRFILLAVILIAAVVFVFAKYQGRIVTAVASQAKPSPFVRYDTFESVVQSSIDVVYRDLDAMKVDINKNKQSIDEINTKLENIEKSLNEIKATLDQ